MAWRGQGGGKRAKGRRGDQDPELDNTAWLAELEREATAHADDDDEDDWASTLRGRRAPNPPPSDPGWVPSSPPPSPPPDHRHLDPDPGAAGPAYGPGGESAYEPGGGSTSGSAGGSEGASAYEPGGGSEGASAYEPGGGSGDGSSAWSAPSTSDPMPPPRDPMPGPLDPIPPPPDPIPAPPDPMPGPPDPMPAPRDPIPDPDWSWHPPATDGYGEPATHLDPGGFGEPRRDPGADGDWGGVAGDPGDGGWRAAGADTPTGTWSPAEPVGREPDYPALFGELYRRSAAQQDPIWEAPPAAEPLPEHGQPDPPPTAWPFEETTQSWEPTDRSFIWPADELPSTSTEWDRPTPGTWLEDPDPQPPTASTPAPPPIAPSGPRPAPLPYAPTGPPPADWAAAIPADVPAARRAADPAATRMWRPEEADEPGVPLGEASWPEEGRGPGTNPSSSRAARADAIPADEPGEVRRAAPAKARRTRPAGGERQARAWPRIVAVISWIVLVMVVCWFYVFPWLERVLPENF